MDALPQALRYAWRRLLRNPAASALAVLALGLGIGLTTTMFSSVYGVALRGLPFPESDHIVHLELGKTTDEDFESEVQIHDFRDWRARQRSFEDLAAFYEGTVNLADEGYPERYNGAFITDRVFDILRVAPLHGQGFRAGDDQPGAEPVVVLGYDVFRKRYGADPAIVGRTIRVNGTPTTVIGVMDDGFKFPIKQDVWVPLQLDPAELERGEGADMEVFGRLRDGVSIGEAEAEMSHLAARLAAEYPRSNEGLDRVIVKPYIREFTPDVITQLIVTMLGAVAFVLLIACTNVASLLLERASARSKELATRLALGAERRTVVLDLLAEGLMLSAGGAAVGLGLAYWGGNAIGRMVDAHPDPPYWVTPGLELPVLLFVAGTTVVAGLLAALVPAIQATRMDINSLLKDESRSASSFRIGRFSRVAVVVQIALACTLLLGAGVMTRTVVNLRTADLGFASDNLLTARIGLFESAYPEEGDRLRFWEQLLERLEESSGTVAAVATSSLPLTGRDGTFYRIEGRVYAKRADVRGTSFAVVSSGFFEAFEIPIESGRSFDSRDLQSSEPVVIINRSFAEREWRDTDPLGDRLRLGRGEASEGEEEEPWRTVVGVVPDAWINGLMDDDEAGIYAPLTQMDRRFLSIAVGTRAEPLAFASTLRETVLSLDPDLPIYWLRSMDQVVAENRFFYDLFGSMFASFGVAALLLAAIGIYGVTAFSVGRRTQEIGVRMALGAAPEQVLGMVLRQGALRLAVGLVIGLGLGLALTRLLAGYLWGVAPADPVTYGIIVLFLSVVTLLACLSPARVAMKVDPIEALRYE